jgi:hypothetical protein
VTALGWREGPVVQATLLMPLFPLKENSETGNPRISCNKLQICTPCPDHVFHLDAQPQAGFNVQQPVFTGCLSANSLWENEE